MPDQAANSSACRMSPWTLRFAPSLEREFLEHFVERNRLFAPFAFSTAIIMYALYAILDGILAPAVIDQLLLIRLGYTLPILLLILVAIVLPQSRRFMQPLLALAAFVATISVGVMLHAGWPELRLYFFGVIVINLYAQVFGRLLFTWATAVSVLNVFVYLLFLQRLQPDPEYYAVAFFFICSTLFLGAIAGWSTERLWRMLFLSTRNLAMSNAELRTTSQTDTLTGLLNRRGMLEFLQREHTRLVRSKRSFVIALLDIDHFKQINDTWGHECGDAVLTRLAELFNSVTRKADTIARWGGEEFLFLLPDTRLAGGRIVIEKIRRLVADTPFIYQSRRIPVTITVGLREADANTSIDELLRDADSALYEGKGNGRNQTVVYLPKPRQIINRVVLANEEN